MCHKQSVKHFRSAFPLPVVPATGCLQDVLNGQCFLGMLPLFHWLREVCKNDKYEGPALRACFIIDDPNLHWPRYGFVDYQEIATHAAKENYHVSFATIPLDAWFTHKGTAEAFPGCSSNRLSLGVHGNDHIKTGTCPPVLFIRNGFHFLPNPSNAIERLEKNTGLQVSRVMVPPHGACSEGMLAEFPGNGFEAACISHGSLRAHNSARAWTKTLGYLPCELILGFASGDAPLVTHAWTKIPFSWRRSSSRRSS